MSKKTRRERHSEANPIIVKQPLDMTTYTPEESTRLVYAGGKNTG